MRSSRQRDTIASYDSVARTFLETTRDRGLDEAWLRSFASDLAPGARVIDLGSGPGRDAVALRDLGLRPICLDLSIGMLRAGFDEYPCARIQADYCLLPLRASSVAGIWANASLLHVPPRDLALAFDEISRVLEPRGQLFLSLKQGIGDEVESARYGRPRWFQYWSAADLDHAIEHAGFEIHASSEDRTPTNTWLVRRCFSPSP